MKNFVNLLFGYLLLTNMSLIMALNSGSFNSIKTIEVKGGAENDYLGSSVSSAGDIDGDGYDDIIIGASNQNSQQGAVYIIYGGEASDMIDMMSTFDLESETLNPVKTGFIITGNSGYYDFGSSVSNAGDIDNDGYDDILIGAHGESTSPGAAYVIYGGPRSSMTNIDLSSSTVLNPLTTGFTITGSAGGDWFGCSVSSAGDINNDGFYDIIIGAPLKDGSQANQGAAYVIYGGEKSSMSNIDFSAGATLNPLKTGFMITGNAAGDSLGFSVSSAGDINNDGYGDIIIGAYVKESFTGAAYVVYGGPKSSMSNIVLSSTPLDPLTTGFKITGNAINDYFGRSVRSAGDVDNDGYADIIIGAQAKNSLQGAVYIIYGGERSSMQNIDLSTKTLESLTTGFMITGNKTGDYFGISIGSAGDINNDVYADVIVGAYGANNGQGAAYVIFGGPKTSLSDIDLSSTILDPETTGFSILGGSTNTKIGNSVSACDINNDGYSELIIGASVENSGKGTTYIIFNQCPTNCETCSSSSKCSACSDGYVLINSLCEACPTNCETCSISKSCEVCFSPYLLYSGKCPATCPTQMFPKNGACQDCPAGCSECTSLSACQACLDGYTFSESQCIKDQNSEKIAAGAFEGASLAGAALSSGSSLPFNFGLVAKLIRNFKYMALPVSQELYETFVSWKVASGFMSAPDSWSLKYSSKAIPTVFSRYELRSAFLINFCKPFVMSLIGIAVFAIFKVMEVLVNKNNNEKKSTLCRISRQVNVAASNFALTQFYSNLDDVIFYFVIEMRSTEFETGFRIASSLLAIVLLLVGGLFIGLHSRLIAKYQNLKRGDSSIQLESYEYKCENISLIFKDFKDTNSLIQSFLMVNVGRSVVSSVIFATLFEYPMIQISFLFVLNILMLVYLWKKKSFKELINTCSQIFCEVILFIANVCVFLLALFDHADSYPVTSIENLSKCIIVLNYILLFGCAIFMLFSLLKMLYQSYLEKKKTRVFPTDNSIFASAKLKNSDLALSNQNLSTNNGLINESQDNSHSDFYQNNILKTIGKNHANLDKDLNPRHRQGISHHSSIQNRKSNQTPIESFERSDFSAILQSNPAEDIKEEASQTNLFSNHMLPRSRLVRNREITQARIAQFSRTKENSRYGIPDSKTQDSSLHSGMTLNEDELANQDLFLTSFDMVRDSPPRRGNNLMPRRRAGTMKK